MKKLAELVALRNKYESNFNKEIQFASKKIYSTKKTLLHLDKKGIFNEGADLIDKIYEYTAQNFKFKPNRDFFDTASDFIEQMYKPFYIEEYKPIAYARLEIKWFTDFCKILESYFQQTIGVYASFAVLHALNTYAESKNISEKELDSIAVSLDLWSYPQRFESLGFISWDNSATFEDIVSVDDYKKDNEKEKDSKKYKDEFFKYLKDIKIEAPASSEKTLKSIREASSKYIVKHLDAYPDETMEILSMSLPDGKAVETIEFIAELERKKRQELLAIEHKYAHLFSSGMIERTDAPAELTQKNIEGLDMIRTAHTISSIKLKETESYLKKLGKKGGSDPVLKDIKMGIFLFSDFEKLNDRNIQKLLREVDARDLANAFCKTSPSMLEALFRNISFRAGELLKEDMRFLGNPDKAVIEKSRETIQKIGNRLLNSEDIFLN